MVTSFLAISLLIAPTGVGEGAECPPILRAEEIEMVQRVEVGELERKAYRKGKLSPDRIAVLRSISGWSWSPKSKSDSSSNEK